MTASLILLSGGLDSTAALLHEYLTGPDKLQAVFFDYGQPAAAREHDAARAVADDWHVHLHYRNLRPAFLGVDAGLMRGGQLSARDPRPRGSVTRNGRSCSGCAAGGRTRPSCIAPGRATRPSSAGSAPRA